ncbi:MAG: T9SS type A sorting domain-containing protein, partial [Sphingobacteriia bacterium]
SGLNDVPISIARLNGTNPQNLTLDRSTYSEKTHFFFDFSTNAAFSREPNKSDWDLLFTQIEDVVAPNTYYPFATVLTKKGLRVAEYVNRTNRDTRTDTTGMAFTTSPMTIGHDWKLFTPGAPGAPGTGWSYDDSTAYFVEDAGKDVWRIVFTFYSQGKYKFNKTKVIDRITSRGQATADNGLLSFGVGPNPATSYVDVVYELSQVQGPVRLQLLDLQGRVVQGYSLDARAGFFSHRMALDNVPNGLYLLQLQNGSYQASKRIVVQ